MLVENGDFQNHIQTQKLCKFWRQCQQDKLFPKETMLSGDRWSANREFVGQG